jgi:hypothetical protein
MESELSDDVDTLVRQLAERGQWSPAERLSWLECKVELLRRIAELDEG